MFFVVPTENKKGTAAKNNVIKWSENDKIRAGRLPASAPFTYCLNSCLTLFTHIIKLVQSCFFLLRNNSRMRHVPPFKGLRN